MRRPLGGGRPWSEQKRKTAYDGRMKNQLGSRLGLAHVHDVLQQVCDRTISVEQACDSLGVAKTRLYELRGAYLKARAAGPVEGWRPGVSGGRNLPRNSQPETHRTDEAGGGRAKTAPARFCYPSGDRFPHA